MSHAIPLALHAAYADLVDRCAHDSFVDAFAEAGVFTPKTIRGRRYWYFQTATEDGKRKQKYVGPETPELLERINTHKTRRSDEKDRRAIVSTLIRSAGLPRPAPQLGRVVEGLARAGVFRLQGVLVGTLAYQTYAAMLGVRLPQTSIRTGDVDIAQDKKIFVVVGEEAPPALATLKAIDSSFCEVPHMAKKQAATSYAASGGVRVDFLTPNTGPDTDQPEHMPALGADAEPIRFLDFLIKEPEPAVLLYGEGVYVLVPSPQRYAVHKLIVARRRREGEAKAEKDLRQAESLFRVLAHERPFELKAVWGEAVQRGKKWRRYMGEGLAMINDETRDLTLKTVEEQRSFIPGLDLVFSAPRARYDFDRKIIGFSGEAGGRHVRCAISDSALEDHFGADGADQKRRKEISLSNRDEILKMARVKYLEWPIEHIGEVIITSDDIPRLRARIRETN